MYITNTSHFALKKVMNNCNDGNIATCSIYRFRLFRVTHTKVSCCHYTRGKDPGLSAAVTDQSPFCQFQARYLHMSYSPDLTLYFRSIVDLTNPDSPVIAPHWMQSWHCVCWRKSVENSNSRCTSRLWT